jgi:hypothetical protein
VCSMEIVVFQHNHSDQLLQASELSHQQLQPKLLIWTNKILRIKGGIQHQNFMKIS